MCVCVRVFVDVCLSVHLSVCLCVCPFVYVYACLSVYGMYTFVGCVLICIV